MASKNFKRNSKRYRMTVLSLFMSVVLFISASSFCTYLTDLVGAAGSNHVSASLTYHTVGQERSDPDGMRKMFAGVAGVTGCSYADLGDIRPFFPLDTLTAQQRLAAEQMAHRTVDGQETAEVYAFIAFLDDDSFRELCRENGVDPAEFFHRDDPRALFYNRSAGRMFFQDEGVSRWYDREVVETKRLPLTVRLFLEREFEGYTLMEIEGDVYRYYPNEAVEQYYQAVNDGEAERLDPAMVMIKTEEEALETFQLTLQQVIRQPMALQPQDSPTVIYPYSMEEAVLGQGAAERFGQTFFAIQADDHAGAYDAVGRELSRRGMDTARLFDQVAEAENMRLLVTAVRVFSYGFILLISLIAAANVFNTISTNVMLRRRELAMLKSIGLGRRGLRRMMNYECLIYGCKALLWGLPAAVGLTWAIWRIIGGVMDRGFYIPWHSAVIAVGSVFAVVFATMLYAMRLIGKDNPVDALKQENL